MTRRGIDQLGIVGVLVITALAFVAVVRPLLGAQTARLLAERELSTKKDEQARLLADVADTSARVGGLAEQVAVYKDSFEASSRLNERIGEVTSLAETLGVQLESIKPGRPVESSGFTSIGVSLAGRADADALTDLVSRTRTLFPDIGVRSFSISGDPGTDARLVADLVWFQSGAGRND
ncbi:MAG: hypothetical protein AAFR96_08760 [Planctomycetota bacterium]